MAHQAVSFEWSVAEDEPVWHRQTAVDINAADITLSGTGEQRLLALLVRIAVLILFAVLPVTGASSVPTPPAPVRLQQEIQAALQREELTWKNNDVDLFNQLLDRQTKREWRRDWFMPWGIEPEERAALGARVERIELQGDLVLVYTLITRPTTEWWRAIPYREVRYYRQTESGWVRTAPAPEDWGRLRTLATPHLRFTFYERDTPSILAIAARVELAYLRLYALLGRQPAQAAIELTFTITPDRVREFNIDEGGLAFASPLLAKAPAGLTHAEYTAHLVVNQLADRVLQEMLANTGRRSANRWRTMLWAVSGRLRSVVLEQRSPWQQQAEFFFHRATHDDRPLRLTDISDRYSSERRTREAYLWEYMAAESIVAYVVQTYGWEGLADLIYGFGEFSYWNGLIPSVFGVTVADFEAGWNRYTFTRAYRAGQSLPAD